MLSVLADQLNVTDVPDADAVTPVGMLGGVKSIVHGADAGVRSFRPLAVANTVKVWLPAASAV